jgi:SAM-dependent methyltransferase
MAHIDSESGEFADVSERLSARLLHNGKALVGALGIGPGESILDIGCGTGRLAEFVARVVGQRGRVIGIDPLTFRVNLSHRRALPNFTARVGRAEDLYVFADSSFDVVLMNSVFHWLQDQRQALAEAARVLRPGGRIGISTLAKERPYAWQVIFDKVFGSNQPGGEDSGTWGGPNRVDSDELGQLLMESGFGCVNADIRTFVDHFRDVDEVIEFEFGAVSSHGNPTDNFYASLPPEQRRETRAALARELGAYTTPTGIRLDRHLIFAVAYKAEQAK